MKVHQPEERNYYPLNKIRVKPGFNPRVRTKPNEELLGSIEVGGIALPIHVGKLSETDRKWFVIEGERRFRAAKELGFEEIPVEDHGLLTVEEALILCLTLNGNREPLDETEIYNVYARLREAGISRDKVFEITGLGWQKGMEFEAIQQKGSKSTKEAVKKSRKKGGLDSRTGARISHLPKGEQEKLVGEVKGKSRKEAIKKVRSKGRQLGIRRPGKQPKEEKKQEVPDTGRIVFRDDYPIAVDFKDRLQILEYKARIYADEYPKNPVWGAYLEIIDVLKGKSSVSTLFGD